MKINCKKLKRDKRRLKFNNKNSKMIRMCLNVKNENWRANDFVICRRWEGQVSYLSRRIRSWGEKS